MRINGIDFAGVTIWYHDKLKVTFRTFHFGKEVTLGGFPQCPVEADWGYLRR